MELLRFKFLFIPLIAFAFATSCHSGTSKTNTEQTDQSSLNRENRKKPGSSFADSLFIDSASIVFFEPDSLQMEKIKGVNEKMIYESLTHDCFYQMRNARQVIEKNYPGMPIKLATKIRWLVFRMANGADSTIDLNHINDICGIYLFDPARNPVRIVMTNIDSEMGFYFRRK